jgi:hypothetical protein
VAAQLVASQEGLSSMELVNNRASNNNSNGNNRAYSSIPFVPILIYLRANSTAQGPIAKRARVRERKTYTKYKTSQSNNYNL